MTLSPGARKGMLAVHLVASIGWIGSVTAFLLLAIAGLTSNDHMLVRGSYIAADLIMLAMIVPLCFGSLITGLVIALGTPWGLFRHYWVLISLLVNVFATGPLLLHTQPAGVVARAAAMMPLTPGDLRETRVELVVTAAAALLLLLVATTLNVYKPQGLTPYGWRKQRERIALLRAKVSESQSA